MNKKKKESKKSTHIKKATASDISALWDDVMEAFQSNEWLQHIPENFLESAVEKPSSPKKKGEKKS